MARKALSPGTAKPRQIASALGKEIRSGRLSYGDRLDSEMALVERFSVSRATVRKGLEELASQGLITTRVGIGSFVTYDGKQIDDSLGWARALSNIGARIETRILRLETIEDALLAEKLKITGMAFIALDRLRFAPDEPCSLSLEYSRLPVVPAIADLPQRGLVDGSLNKTLVAAGMIAASGEEWADIEILAAPEATLLDVAPGSPFLRTRRTVRQLDGGVIEHVTSLLNPAHFALRLEF